MNRYFKMRYLSSALLIWGCASGGENEAKVDATRLDQPNSPPKAMISENVAPVTIDTKGTEAARTDHALPGDYAASVAEVRRLSSDLQRAIGLSENISDVAQREFETSVKTLERGAEGHAKSLRSLLESPKANAALRGKALYLLGRIGADADVQLLERLADAPLPKRAVQSPDAHADHDVADDESALRWSAVYALSGIAQRKNASAVQSLRNLAGKAQKDIAIAAALELVEQSLLDSATQKALTARGLPAKFPRLKSEEVFRIPTDQLALKDGSPAAQLQATMPTPPAN